MDFFLLHPNVLERECLRNALWPTFVDDRAMIS